MKDSSEMVIDMDCKICGVKLKVENTSCASLGEGLCQECEHDKY